MDARKEPAPIGGVLDQCLDRAVGTPGAAAIWRVWGDAVGPAIARRAEPIRLRGRTLMVAVASAPWMQELCLLRRGIVTALNQRLPRPLVDDLYFILTESRETAMPARRPRPPERCATPPAAANLDHLPDAVRASFDAMLSAWQRRARR